MSEKKHIIESVAVIDLLRQFILSNFPLAKQKEIKDDDPLLDGGIIDSLGVLDLINFSEREFGITISDEDLLPDNFQTINGIVDFIERKRNL
jgi:acyl carrier protein